MLIYYSLRHIYFAKYLLFFNIFLNCAVFTRLCYFKT